MKNKINAKIVADSISPRGHRITTFLLTYPRFIHSELMTHRMFSRNSASSRAIPFKKMVKMVEEDPFIPIAWQKDHSGMQGIEYLTDVKDVADAQSVWLSARDEAVGMAKLLNKNEEVTKQLCNRLLEPFMWHTVLVTATEYDNFFELRCPKYQTPVSQTIEPQRSWKDLIDNHSNPINLDKLEENQDNWAFKMQHSLSGAEIHIQALAESMWDVMNESIPNKLEAGEWHIPFGNQIDSEKLTESIGFKTSDYDWYNKEIWSKIQIATARCARLSYMTFDGEIDYEKDIKLHDQLLESKHASPYEHVSRCLTEEEYNTLGKMILDPVKGYIFEKGWVDNFKGFVSYRRILNF